MGDLLYRAREKCAAYSHLLDLKKKLQDLQTEVPSIRRNYRYWELNNQISIAYLQWDSIKLPPFAFSQVNRVVNTEATKKEGFIDESVPKLSQVITPISIPDATSDSTLDSDSKSGAKTDLVTGLNGFSRPTSTIEDSANSSGDFIASQSEEIEFVPTDVDDEDDSIDLELIPKFLIVETEEDDDCLELDLLIPSFFFDEEDDLPAELNFETTEVLSNEGSCKKLQSLKEFGSHNKAVISKTRFPLLPAYTRIIDPGKDFKLIQRFSYLAGIYEVGSDSIVGRLTNKGVLSLAETLFDKMSWRSALKLSYTGVDFFKSADIVFDRGKEFQLVKGLSSFVGDSRYYLDPTSYVILMTNYKGYSVHKLINRTGYQSNWLFSKKSSYPSINLTGSVFDRGRGIEPMGRKLCIRLLLSFGYELNNWVIHSMGLVFVAHTDILDDSKLFIKKSKHSGTWLLLLFRVVRTEMALELAYKVGYRSDWLFGASILYVSTASGAEFSFLGLQCTLLGVNSIQCWFFKFVLKIISASPITYIWLGQSEPGTSFHLVLLFYNDPEVHYCYLVSGLVWVMRRKLMCIVLQIPYVLLLVVFLRWPYTLCYTGLGSVQNVHDTISVIIWLLETQVLLNVIQILNVLIWFEYLRWKFRLVSTVLWRLRNGTSNTVFHGLVFDRGKMHEPMNGGMVEWLVSPGLRSVKSNTMAVPSSVMSRDTNGQSESNSWQLKMGIGLSNTTTFILAALRVFSADCQLIDKLLQQGPLIWKVGYGLLPDIELVHMGSLKRGVNAQRQMRSYSCSAMQWVTTTGDVYLSQLSFLHSPLLTPEVFAGLATHARIILTVRQFLRTYMHTFYPACYLTPHCKNLTALYAFDLSEYYFPCYPAIWKFATNGDSQLKEVLIHRCDAEIC